MSTAKTTAAPLFIHPSDLAIQTSIRLPLHIVEGNVDYREREALLRRMDHLLTSSGVESAFLSAHVAAARTSAVEAGKPLTDRMREAVQQYAKSALRCTIARMLSNESHRNFSCHLAESPLLQWFCGMELGGVIRVPAKSSLQRMESDVPVELIREVHAMLLKRSVSVNLMFGRQANTRRTKTVISADGINAKKWEVD